MRECIDTCYIDSVLVGESHMLGRQIPDLVHMQLKWGDCTPPAIPCSLESMAQLVPAPPRPELQS